MGRRLHVCRPRRTKTPGIHHLLAATLVLAATPALARDPVFRLPLDCTLGEDCYINDYVDLDAGPGRRDYTCGGVTRDNHRGTDFAVFTEADLNRGYDVVAAAPGTVVGIRDSLPDIPQGREDSPDVTDRECGNGVGIRHGSGWFTQYCHLAQGSIAVSVGDRVAAGTVLGQIGFSGVTSYPHLHFDVRKDGVPVDPFSGASPNTDTTCTPPDATEEATLWRDLPAYQDGGLVRIGFAGREVAYEEVQAGFASPATLPVTTPVLIAWLHGYAGQEGDALSLTVTGPDGSDWTTRDVTLGERGLKFFYRYTGRRLTTDAWDPGLYTLTVRHSRDGALIEEDIATITLTDR